MRHFTRASVRLHLKNIQRGLRKILEQTPTKENLISLRRMTRGKNKNLLRMKRPNGYQQRHQKMLAGVQRFKASSSFQNIIKTRYKTQKKTFFDLSQKYYTDKYTKRDSKGNMLKDENKKILDVRSYLRTENHDNFIIDMQLEIIQTNQGCMPIVKTFEKNAYNDN